MMALKSPMLPPLPSPNGTLISAFSPYSESPTSPQRFSDSPINRPTSSDHQHPGLLQRPMQSSPLATSPSDIADPSPISTSSNSTDTTNIDETEDLHEEADATPQPPIPAEDAQSPEEIGEPVRRFSDKSQGGERASLQLETKHAAEEALRPRSDEDEQPSSVIHAPLGFDAFAGDRQSPNSVRQLATPTPTQEPEAPVLEQKPEEPSEERRSPVPPQIQTTIPPARDWSNTPRAQTRPEAEAHVQTQSQSQTPIQPQPQSGLSARPILGPRSVSRSSDLADIPEARDVEQYENEIEPNENLFEDAIERFQESEDEVAALKIALSECWTLCNTLAGLSYIHRERIFSFSGKGDRQEQAWKSCWKLCQKLYETRDEKTATQVRPTLDLCKDFCQCLFEVRQRENDKADSVLRVSFELNNHLYNTHDRSLPEAFRERTLDFYITLCHRLMKQKSELAQETDSLLGACWSLAEMLFSLRQNKREGKAEDEELLGSAVQACWELCDLFREGWTQIRPDRGTPRPSQTTFTQAFQQAKQSQQASIPFSTVPQESDEAEDGDVGRANPETPTTVFEDTQQMSPNADDDTSPVPNILVLGAPDQATRDQQAAQRQRQQQQQQQQHQQRQTHTPYSSTSSSTLSNFSKSSKSSKTTTSSTSTVMNQDPPPQEEDPHLTCLKLLILRAALNVGYQRPRSPSLTRSPPLSNKSSTTHNKHQSTSTTPTPTTKSSPPNSTSKHPKPSTTHNTPTAAHPPSSSAPTTLTLSSFVKTLPSNSFGSQLWQTQLLDSYKKLVASDPSFSNQAFGPVRRAKAADVARSVRWMVGGHAGRYTWLRDLYRLVFGFRIDEGERGVDAFLQA